MPQVLLALEARVSCQGPTVLIRLHNRMEILVFKSIMGLFTLESVYIEKYKVFHFYHIYFLVISVQLGNTV